MAIVIAAIGIGALGVGLSRLPRVHHSVASAPAGSSVVMLADGSPVTLDGEAQLEMPINEPAHVVASLERGSARFDVAPAPGRSFTVIVGDVEVRVVGTQLRVDHDPTSHAVTVAVLRGAVEVRNAAEPGEVHQLDAGQTWSAPRPEIAMALPPAPSPGGPAVGSTNASAAETRASAAPSEDARSLPSAATRAKRSGDFARASRRIDTTSPRR